MASMQADLNPIRYRGPRMPEELRPWLNPAHELVWEDAEVLPLSALGDEVVLGRGWLAEQPCRYRLDYLAQSIRLRLDADLECLISDDGETVDLISAESADLAALLGPPLLLAQARRGRHAVHASAAMAPNGKTMLFTAPSGSGKSTLARVAEAIGWRRLADDLIPLDARARLHPRFPQLKLGPWPLPLPAQVRLDGLVMVDRAPSAALRALSVMEMARLLLAASVGTRMYSAAMCGEHLQWATSVAGRLGPGRGWALTLAEHPAAPEQAAEQALARLLETAG